MMGEEILHWLIGGIIGAIIGAGFTFLGRLYRDKKIQKRNHRDEDRYIFAQIVGILSDLIATVESEKSINTSRQNFKDLETLYSMIQSEENRDLVDEIQILIQEYRRYDAVSYKPLREKIRLLKSKIIERVKPKSG